VGVEKVEDGQIQIPHRSRCISTSRVGPPIQIYTGESPSVVFHSNWDISDAAALHWLPLASEHRQTNFFKIVCTFNQGRLRLLCGEDFFLKFYDRRIATGSVVDILQSLRDIERGLERANSGE
jgi:hypothetical protein